MTFYDMVMAERAARERYYELLREAEVERLLRAHRPMPKRPALLLRFSHRRPRGWTRTPQLRPQTF